MGGTLGSTPGERDRVSLAHNPQDSAFPVRGLTTRGGIGDNAILHAGGGVAQLGEHHVRNVGVEGSIPFSSTTFLLRTTNIHQGIEPASGADV